MVLGIPGLPPSRRPELPQRTRGSGTENVWILDWTYFRRARAGKARGSCGRCLFVSFQDWTTGNFFGRENKKKCRCHESNMGIIGTESNHNDAH